MNKADEYLIKNLTEIMENGVYDEDPRGRYKSDGAPAHSKFITQVFEEYDLSEGEFPIPTLAATAKKSGVSEVLWIYQDQSSSIKRLEERGVHWWKDWDIGDGTIGQRYGATVKKYNLMFSLLNQLEKNPFSRRHLMSLWQEADFLETDGLVPCAYQTSWSVRPSPEDREKLFLDMHLHQRSNDYLMAGAINKVQYVALQMMVAGHLRFRGMDIEVGKFTHFVQNLHVYNRHEEYAKKVLDLVPINTKPKMRLKEDKIFTDYNREDIIFSGDEFYNLERNLDIAI